MKLRIGVLTVLGVAAVTAGSIGAMSGLVLKGHRDAQIAQLTQGADQLSETIVSSTFWDMLENHRPALHREMLTIGRQKGIEKIRLFNATGKIMFSSDESETGHTLDKKAEEPVDLRVNGKLVARGEVVLVDDTYGLRITQIVDAAGRIESLR